MWFGSTGEVTVLSQSCGAQELDYQLNNGWVAFTDPDSEDHLQVWTLSGLCEKKQITDLESSSRINALGPNGELTFENGGRLYLAMLDSTVIEIGSSSCESFWQDGQWFVIDEGTLSVVPEPSTLLLVGIGGLALLRKGN